jgi:two-component system chemotaxis response regulator CheY
MRALVIDDSRAIRALIGSILRKHGYGVSEAGSGREGLENLKKTGVPNLALVDWNMPEMNGIDFVRAVRAQPEYVGMPILMVTTETEMCQVQQALDAGADEYLMKPFTAETLMEKLELLRNRS